MRNIPPLPDLDPAESIIRCWAGGLDEKITVLKAIAVQFAAKTGTTLIDGGLLRSRDGRLEKLENLARCMYSPTPRAAVSAILHWSDQTRATTDSALLQGVPTLQITQSRDLTWVMAVPTESGSLRFWIPLGSPHECESVWLAAARRAAQQQMNIRVGAHACAISHATHVHLSSSVLASPRTVHSLLNQVGIDSGQAHVLLTPAGGLALGLRPSLKAQASQYPIRSALFPLTRIPPLPWHGQGQS